MKSKYIKTSFFSKGNVHKALSTPVRRGSRIPRFILKINDRAEVSSEFGNLRLDDQDITDLFAVASHISTFVELLGKHIEAGLNVQDAFAAAQEEYEAALDG